MANLQKCCCLYNYDQPKEPAHLWQPQCAGQFDWAKNLAWQ